MGDRAVRRSRQAAVRKRARETGEEAQRAEEARQVRLKARQQILRLVNKGRIRREPYTAGQIQLAVHAGRQRGILSDGLLIAAGFRPARSTAKGGRRSRLQLLRERRARHEARRRQRRGHFRRAA